ncbi:MAG TPA: PDR/VanB family oxidoreductase [Xanthobacteraceae bacterium]|nr:PDR/VanB family oxidoreductase [Xanthobacteraceae bacterium]
MAKDELIVVDMTGGGAAAAAPGPTLSLKVVEKSEIAAGIFLFALERDDRAPLPPFTAGSHILVQTPGGLTRRYSLCGTPSVRDRYSIAVKREDEGGGGSRSMVEEVQTGDHLQVSEPENYFPLADDATIHILIAGGIGITPILSMARQLSEKQAPFKLIYCTRSPETTAFHADLCEPEFADRILLHHDYGDRERSLDLGAILADRPDGAHVYCCGPRPLMNAVRDMSRHWPRGTVHFEDFGTSEPVTEGAEKTFRVRLARSNTVVEVPLGMSILEAVRRHGIEVPSSCESGTCGTCRTGLLAGVAEHRDYVLDDDEYDSAIMICVSRAKSDELTLDL